MTNTQKCQPVQSGLLPIDYPSNTPRLFAGDVELYHRKVLIPTFESIDQEVYSSYCGYPDELTEDDHRLDLVRNATARAHWLALASTWENQLREYLLTFGRETNRADLVKASKCPQRKVVVALVSQITGQTLEPKDGRLEEYILVSNVCRHGAGESLRQLFKKYKQNWWPATLQGMQEDSPLLYNLHISAEKIADFTNEIVAAWEKVQCTDGKHFLPAKWEPVNPSSASLTNEELHQLHEDLVKCKDVLEKMFKLNVEALHYCQFSSLDPIQEKYIQLHELLMEGGFVTGKVLGLQQ